MLSLAACSRYSTTPQLPHPLTLLNQAVEAVDYQLQRFTIDKNGQAYGSSANKIYKIDSITDELVELFRFNASIVGFHITASNEFIVSTDNNHWDPSVPCIVYRSENLGKSFHKLMQINGGCPVWMSISSDQDYIYIGEYGPKNPNLSKSVWRYHADNDQLKMVFQAPMNSTAHIHRVAVDPYTNNLWVTVGDTRKNRGVYLSENQGQSWVRKLDSQATGVEFFDNKIYWGEDKKGHGLIVSTSTTGDKPVTVFNARQFGNYAGSIYELLALPDGALLAPIMKYDDGKNVASLWYERKGKWELLMIFESLPGQGKDTSSIAGPDKNGFVFLTGFKINWQKL